MAEGLVFDLKIKAHINTTRPKQLEAATVRALEQGAKWIMQEAKNKVPVKTGKLKKSLNIRNIPGGKGIGSNLDYASHVEFGTMPHRISAKNKKVLHFMVDGEDVFVTHVHHPGTSEQQYLRPALDETKSKIIKYLHKQVRKALS